MAICVICIKRSQRYNVQTISCSNPTFLCLLKGFYTCDGCMYIVVREAKICNHLPIIICLVLINTLCCWKSQLGTTHECVYLHSIFVKTIHGRSSKNKKNLFTYLANHNSHVSVHRKNEKLHQIFSPNCLTKQIYRQRAVTFLVLEAYAFYLLCNRDEM